MNVSLTPELEGYVQANVHTGRYTSASEVVREALREMQNRDEARSANLEAMRARIKAGIDDLEAGRSVSGTREELLSEAKREARRRHGLSDS